MAARLDSVLPNPPAQVLALRDSVSLTSAQITTLEVARDSLSSELHVIADSLRTAAAALDGSSDRREAMTRMRAQFGLAREAVTRSLDTVRATLTTDQWNRLPETIRNPRFGGGAR